MRLFGPPRTSLGRQRTMARIWVTQLHMRANTHAHCTDDADRAFALYLSLAHANVRANYDLKNIQI